MSGAAGSYGKVLVPVGGILCAKILAASDANAERSASVALE
jgi:hypothetical protein